MAKTRNDVAAMAGVSSATVSRVYNQPDSVSAEKKEAVFEAAEHLGYLPDKSASALRRTGSGRIALVLPVKSDQRWYWGHDKTFQWFFTDVLMGIKRVFDPSIYQLILYTPESLEDLKIQAPQFDGLLFFDADREDEVECLRSLNVPVVAGHHSDLLEGVNSCCTDNFTGGRLVGRSLTVSGHRRTLYVTGLLEQVSSHRQRLEGFLDGFSLGSSHILEGEVGRAGGRELIHPFIPEIRKGIYDSVACVNDLTAIGVIHLFQEEGLIIGRDVSLVGYDNMPFNYALPFHLASVELEPGRIYESAARALLGLIQSGGRINRLISPRFITGNSLRSLDLMNPNMR